MALLRPSVLLSSLTAFVLYLTIATTPLSAAPVSSAFTYQGQLSVKGSGNQSVKSADIRFSLFDAAAGGTQIGTTNELSFGRLPGGRFTATLDFGAGVFNGDARWLEISVRTPAGSGSYKTLTPRQALNAAPYALHAMTPAGRKGDKGDTGAKGAKGDQGNKGEQGLKGDTGAKGETGQDGETGPKGDKGETGPKGETGFKGDKGETGPKGDTGFKGDKGETGPKGETGHDGETGPKGETGQKGDTGPKGDQGPAGVFGPKGETGATGPKASSTSKFNQAIKVSASSTTPTTVPGLDQTVSLASQSMVLVLANGIA